MSMVTRTVSEPGSYSAGTPLMPTTVWKRNAVRMKQLNTMHSRLTALETELEAGADKQGK
jgi:UDP-3-O-[3-hydroxymyristoyl] glucosamine N-acyltransferase